MTDQLTELAQEVIEAACELEAQRRNGRYEDILKAAKALGRAVDAYEAEKE